MKLLVPFSTPTRACSPKLGFTLVEILIAMGVFMMLITGVIFANLFGLKMFQINKNKITATRWARDTMQNLTDQIHGCNSVQVGTYTTNGGFAGFLPGETVQGNGLLIYPTANTTNYTLYYVNLPDQTFWRADQSGNTVELADSVTNQVPFSAQDAFGNVLTNNAANEVIHVVLEFSHPASYMMGADYYKLETSVKQRVQ